MSNNEVNKRFSYIHKFIMIICIILCMKIMYLNIIEKEHYSMVADDSIYKDIVIPAPRGEIRDRNGVLLAGNKPIFTVKISKNEIEQFAKTNKQKKEKLNEVSAKLETILTKNKESIEDSFPIIIDKDEYKFYFDEEIRKWKESNNIEQEKTAKESFYIVAEKYIKQAGISMDLKSASTFEVQTMLNDAGIYPPISIKDNMEFTKILDKQQWLMNYGINTKDINAKDAFAKIRENRLIDASLSDVDARKILVIVDAVISKNYLQYEPTLIAKDISQKTVASIKENIVDLYGVSVDVEPLRYYPQGNLGAHIIGQIGKISTQDEHYLEDDRYSKADYVGKSGVEFVYEKHLKGTNGYEKVLVDSVGRKIQNIDYQDSVPGKAIYLSMDVKLQKVAETALEKTLKTLQVGGVYDSKWGDMKLRGATRVYKNANAGAIVALDVKTGKVLAMASYPSYDPNMFTTGLTKAQYESLQPENPNDPLSPKPLFNAATMTAVQPGSTFKMVSALAGLENGLNPYYSIEDKGVIEVGGVPFGNWLWNETRQTQGFENVITALRDSNNYYFYCISVGHNYATDEKIPMGDMRNGKSILEMAQKFGLDQKTGIEIYEVVGKIPDPRVKYEQQKASLKRDITNHMKDKFKDIKSDSPIYKERIETIISWIDENPSRAEIIKRLRTLKVKDAELEKIADLLKYTYFIHANWSTGDIFNMVIGQGEHQYTPLQIANYISAIANGGYINKVSVIEKLVDNQTGVEEVIENVRREVKLGNKGNLEYIKQGMIDVTDEGTAKDIFANFPIRVAAKTGTAETQGKIPTKDEVGYYLSHLADYGVDKTQVLELAKKLKSESKYNYKEEYYIQSAILELNPNLTLDNLNAYKETYADYSWFVAYAPYDNPQIAVVTLLFQGGSGGHAGPATRDVIAQYMGINDEEVLLNDEKDDLKIQTEKENIVKKEEYVPPVEPIYTQPVYTPPQTPKPPPKVDQQAPKEPQIQDTAPPSQEQVENTNQKNQEQPQQEQIQQQAEPPKETKVEEPVEEDVPIFEEP